MPNEYWLQLALLLEGLAQSRKRLGFDDAAWLGRIWNDMINFDFECVAKVAPGWNQGSWRRDRLRQLRLQVSVILLYSASTTFAVL